MKLNDLKIMVKLSETIYEQIDKSSFEELTGFMKTFSEIYTIFQTRERYKIVKANIPSELKALFDENDPELALLSQRTLSLANSIDHEFQKFRTPKNPSLLGKFATFFAQSASAPKASSSNSHHTEAHQTDSNNSITLDTILKKYNANDKNIALRRAALQGGVADVELLINKFKADIDSQSSNGFTALDWAFYNDQMEPDGTFTTLCRLGANQSTLKSLLEKYVDNDPSAFPTKDIALARALKKENEADVTILIDKYKANIEKAQEILLAETATLGL